MLPQMRAALLIVALSLPGCQNSCQQICGTMAAYARDCGHTVPEAQVKACREAQAGEASKDDREICRTAGDGSTLRDEWTCDDLAVYWSRVETSDTGDSSW